MKRTIFLLLIALQSQAQQVFTSVDQFTEYALKQNVSLQQAVLNEKIEQQNRNSAISPLLPSISASAALNDNLILNTSLIPAEIFGGTKGTFKEVQFGTKYNINPNGSFSLNLINGANYGNLMVARKNMQVAAQKTAVLRDQLKAQIAQAYYLCLLYQKNVQFASENQSNADSLFHIVSIRYNNQFVDELEWNRARNAAFNASSSRRQSELAYQKALNQLKLLAAIPANQTVEIKDAIAYSASTPVFGNIGQRPIMRQAQLQEEAGKLTLTRERLRFLPELSVYGNYGWNAQGNSLNFKSEQWYKNSLVGIRLDVPIFSGAIRYFNVEKARLNEQIARLQQEQVAFEAAKNDRDLLLEFNKSRDDVSTLQQQLTMASRNYQLALLKYKNEALNYDNLVSVNNELLNTQQQLLQAEANYVTVQYQIKLNSGY
ncbi:MAG: TolC family protein [Chitinophagales bacterium]